MKSKYNFELFSFVKIKLIDMTYNILVHDECPMFRIGLKVIIDKRYPMCDVYTAESLESLTEQVAALTFDIIILDINNDGFNKFSILKEIKALQPNTNLIVTSFSTQIDFNTRCFSGGACAVLNKTCTDDNLAQALNIFLFSGSYSANSTKLFLKLPPKKKKGKVVRNKINALSVREYEIALLLISGETAKQISHKLSIASTTVSTLKRRIFTKTSTENIIQLSKIFERERINYD